MKKYCLINTLVLFVAVSLCCRPAFAELVETHPFVLYSADEFEAIRARIDSEPFNGWFEDELEKAEAILALSHSWGDGSEAPETEAYYAKVLTFSYVFSEGRSDSRDLFAAEAARALAAIPNSSYGSRFSSDLSVSEAALFWAEAYDMLAGAGYDFSAAGGGVTGSAVRSRLSALRDYMEDDNAYLPILPPSSPAIGFDFTSSIWIEGAADNHHVKLQAALSVLSLATLGDSGAQGILDDAVEKLAKGLELMTPSNGASGNGVLWAEGPNYHLYSTHQYLAAVDALRRRGVVDLYSDIFSLAACHLTLPEFVMPDGYMPPWDDNRAAVFNIAGLLYSYHAGLEGRDMLHWLWRKGGSPVPSAFRADYIARFDDSVPTVSSPADLSDEASAFFPESGFARLQSSWDSDAVWLLLQSEHGGTHTNGRAHEHPDPNSVILHACGELLLIDSGYAGWSNRDATKFAENHNIVLVDGAGPPASSQPPIGGVWSIGGTGSLMGNCFTADRLDYASSSANYENTDFTRHAIVTSDGGVILYDVLTANAVKEYTLLLHGNGGGSSGGTFESHENGALWERDNAALRSFTVASGDEIALTSRDLQHAVYSNELLTHTMLEIKQRGEIESYLTFLAPSRTADTMPSITAIEVENGQGIGISNADGRKLVLQGPPEGSTVRVNGGGVESDAVFCYLEYDADETVQSIMMIDGSIISDASGPVAMTDARATLYVDYSDEYIIAGHVIADGSRTLSLHNVSAETLTVDGAVAEFMQDGGTLTFNVPGEAVYVVTREREPVVLLPPSDVIVSDVDGDNGHVLDISWTASPSEQDGLVDEYRVYRSRADEFGEVVALDDFEDLDSLIAWEEHAVVLVGSVAAGQASFRDLAVPLNGVVYRYWIESAAGSHVSEKAASNWQEPLSVKEMPEELSILNPFPNPFNMSVTIPVRLMHESQVELAVYDISGAKVATLQHGTIQPGLAGFNWNGLDDSGRTVSSGVYIVRLVSDTRSVHRRILLMK